MLVPLPRADSRALINCGCVQQVSARRGRRAAVGAHTPPLL